MRGHVRRPSVRRTQSQATDRLYRSTVGGFFFAFHGHHNRAHPVVMRFDELVEALTDQRERPLKRPVLRDKVA